MAFDHHEMIAPTVRDAIKRVVLIFSFLETRRYTKSNAIQVLIEDYSLVSCAPKST
jgi:hypothetical protein